MSSTTLTDDLELLSEKLVDLGDDDLFLNALAVSSDGRAICSSDQEILLESSEASKGWTQLYKTPPDCVVQCVAEHYDDLYFLESLDCPSESFVVYCLQDFLQHVGTAQGRNKTEIFRFDLDSSKFRFPGNMTMSMRGDVCLVTSEREVVLYNMSSKVLETHDLEEHRLIHQGLLVSENTVWLTQKRKQHVIEVQLPSEREDCLVRRNLSPGSMCYYEKEKFLTISRRSPYHLHILDSSGMSNTYTGCVFEISDFKKGGRNLYAQYRPLI